MPSVMANRCKENNVEEDWRAVNTNIIRPSIQQSEVNAKSQMRTKSPGRKNAGTFLVTERGGKNSGCM